MSKQDQSQDGTDTASLADLKVTTQQAEQTKGGVLRGGGGRDVLIGGDGQDWIVGGTGQER